jgi:hypothetical protein
MKANAAGRGQCPHVVDNPSRVDVPAATADPAGGGGTAARPAAAAPPQGCTPLTAALLCLGSALGVGLAVLVLQALTGGLDGAARQQDVQCGLSGCSADRGETSGSGSGSGSCAARVAGMAEHCSRHTWCTGGWVVSSQPFVLTAILIAAGLFHARARLTSNEETSPGYCRHDALDDD